MELGEGMCDHMAFHIVGAKPSEASHCQRGALDEASDQSRQGHQCNETAPTGETWFHCEFVHPRDAIADPLDGKQMVDPPDQ
jgi:hypothetical protein